MADTVHVRASFTILKSPEELYRFWRNLENLPRFMKHVESVTDLGGNRSHWVVRAPAGRTIEWDAEIVAEEEGRALSWRTLPGAEVEHQGRVEFRPATGERGSVASVMLDYDPPGGKAGAVAAKLFGEEPGQQVREDLRRFKQLVETGEIPTTHGQPAGRDESPDEEGEPEATEVDRELGQEVAS